LYANGDRPSSAIDGSVLDDRSIYPDAATMAKLFTIVAHDQKSLRLVYRLWMRIRTGD
jgi:putrescine transport system substrate-binding protein